MEALARSAIRRFLRHYRRPAIPRGAVVLVFGGANERRMRAAAELRRFAPRGYVLSGRPVEVTAMRSEALRQGLSRRRLVSETDAVSTVSNARNCARLLARFRGPVVLVTDDWHMPRAAWLCRWYGLRPIPWCATGHATPARIEREARLWVENAIGVFARLLLRGGRI